MELYEKQREKGKADMHLWDATGSESITILFPGWIDFEPPKTPTKVAYCSFKWKITEFKKEKKIKESFNKITFFITDRSYVYHHLWGPTHGEFYL